MISTDGVARFPLAEQLIGDISPLLAAYPLPELHGKRLFITGATGFMGYWLLLAIHCLNRTGADIHVRALSRNPDTFLEQHPECREMEWLCWSKGDVRSYAIPDERFDAIIHGAADTSPAAAANPEELRDSIVGGTRHVLAHAIACHARRVLLLSSGTVYGEQADDMERIDESSPFQDSSSVVDGYLQGKRAMEALSCACDEGLETVVARCFAFVGYGLPAHLAIGQFIRDAREGDAIIVNGDGQPVRSFLYAADLCVWLLALLVKGRSRHAYNVGSPEGRTLAETATIARDALAPGKPVVIKGLQGSLARRRYLPDVGKAERELDLRVWTQLPEAIRQTARSLEYPLGISSAQVTGIPDDA